METIERPELYEALGRTIQVLRTDQGLDRKDLADRAGISYSYLAAIENGKKPPSSKVLFRIAEALGLRSHELMASVESRWERGASPSSTPRLAAPSQRQAWFHSAAAAKASAVEDEAYASPVPGHAALEESARYRRETTPLQRRVPRSAYGFWRQLESVVGRLDDEGREIVLGLAEKLATRE